MDHFGIGAAMRGMARIYAQTSRHTGRTTSLLESLKDGDRIICTGTNEADHLRRLCKERGLEVDVRAVDPRCAGSDLFRFGTPQGRTVFEHTWVEKRYELALERCEQDINFLQKELSGFGEAHRETRRRAVELSKWS